MPSDEKVTDRHHVVGIASDASPAMKPLRCYMSDLTAVFATARGQVHAEMLAVSFGVAFDCARVERNGSP